MSELPVRRTTAADAGAIAETVTLAFHEDPLWSWVFADDARRADQYRQWWPLFVTAALRNDWSWVTGDAASVALWAAPGQEELNQAEETRFVELVDELIGGDHGKRVLEGLLRFEAAHPRDEPHYYLGFVATHDDHRGKGIGEQLLAQNLELIDAEHMPAYLESSNPKNLARYERLGFRARAEFAVGDGGPVVTTMWRPAR